jgi:hypothetical protein
MSRIVIVILVYHRHKSIDLVAVHLVEKVVVHFGKR